MSMTDDPKKERPETGDSDIVNSEAALLRAAKRAREIARRVDGYVVVYRDGKIVEEHVGDAAA